jgi:diguanylate cyclase (GGDEF)-like protein
VSSRSGLSALPSPSPEPRGRGVDAGALGGPPLEVVELAACHGPDLLLVVDPGGALRFGSLASVRVLGLDPLEHLGDPILDFVHPDDLEQAAGALDEASRSSGSHQPVRMRIRGASQLGWVHCEVTAETVERESGTWMVLSLRALVGRSEVTERREEITRLIIRCTPMCASVGWRSVEAAVTGVLAALGSIVGAGIVTLSGATGPNGSRRAVEWVAPGLEVPVPTRPVHSLWQDGEMTTDLLRLSTDLDDLAASDELDRLRAGGVRTVIEVPLPGAGSSLLRFGFAGDWTSWDDANCDLVRMLGTTLNSTLRRTSTERELYERSRRDPLTGLLNGAEVVAVLEDRLQRAASAGQVGSVGVLFADLDGFKAVNDSLGHAEGDRLLLSVADAFRTEVRDGDVVGRMGGDEFAVVCGRLDAPEDLDGVSRRLEAAVASLGTQDAPLSVSLGSAVARPEEGAKSLIARADMTMLRRKRERRPPA